MKAYESLDAFINDLPNLAEQVKDKLLGQDALYLLETKQGRKLYIQLSDGKLTLPQEPDKAPMCTVSADEEALLGLIQGKTNVFAALMTGKISVQGNSKALSGLMALLS